ncbi:MAG TPA: heavy metal-associated domain-containing protein [Bryobacteraceae bacterium]|nr:heavy metal-associated domain-containing protein [Bryobacteraceae bacterium]
MGLETVKIPVHGMTCGNCARTVERKLSASPGVSSARVDLAGGTATVEFDADRTKLPDLVRAVEQLGYSVKQ